jgi:hypothetical protein
MHFYFGAYNYHCHHIEFKPNISTYKNVKTNNVHKIHIDLYTTIECVGISNHQEWFETTQVDIISHSQNMLNRVHTWIGSK